ncbi:MAG TPA: hypothetical protein VLI93_03175 [Acetobacteraceae bacterium]|nr:hypothetical protein [Acetobacteraceae bacterium]
MDIQVTLLAAGTTTSRELAELSTEVQDALRQRRDVIRVDPVRMEAPSGAKGIAELVGAFLIAVPPDAIKGRSTC